MASFHLNSPSNEAPQITRCSELLRISGMLCPVELAVDEIRYGRDPVQMNAISYTAARENLASTMDRVCNDHAPVIITRNRDQSVVMLSLDDFESLEETAYLMRSPANAQRLLEAIHTLESGQGVVREVDLSARTSLSRRKPRRITLSGRRPTQKR